MSCAVGLCAFVGLLIAGYCTWRFQMTYHNSLEFIGFVAVLTVLLFAALIITAEAVQRIRRWFKWWSTH